jgi:hypothetical protein
MRSFEAINKAISGNTVEVAKKLHLSTSLIRKWQEPTADFDDSGAYNPLDRIEEIIDTAKKCKVSEEDALAPIQYLAEKYNLIIIPIPKTTEKPSEIQKELLKTISEFGELAKAASSALLDGKLTRSEIREIEREAWELIRQVAIFTQKITGKA